MNTEVNMICEPRHREPTRPILAKQHSDSTSKGEESDEKNPELVLFGRMGRVIAERDDADRDE
jgi:hypothetical protein